MDNDWREAFRRELAKDYEPPESTSQQDVKDTLEHQCFRSHREWVNKASSWLTSHPLYSGKPHNRFQATCFDAKGRLCQIGADFRRAKEDDAFPVYWLWPDQIGLVALLVVSEGGADNG